MRRERCRSALPGLPEMVLVQASRCAGLEIVSGRPLLAVALVSLRDGVLPVSQERRVSLREPFELCVTLGA
jgi:hypothetical protein